MHGLGCVYGVFLPSIQAEFGTDRTTVSGVTAVEAVLEAFLAIIFGRLTDKFGSKPLIIFGALVLGVGSFLMSRTASIWQLYLFYAFMIGLGQGAGNVSLLSTVAKWFVKDRGLMSSIVKVGTGAGILIFPLIAGSLISTYHWRTTYLILGLACMVLIIPLALVLKREPKEMGLQPYGINDKISKQVIGPQLALREALRTHQFWGLSVVFFVAFYVTQSILVHIVTYAQGNGIPAAPAAVTLSIIGGISIGGRLVMGRVGDRVGNRRALLIIFTLLIIAVTWLQIGHSLWMIYLFAVIYGFAHGGFFAVMSPVVAEMFGVKHQGVNFGMMLLIAMMGSAAGPLLTGRIFDVTGGYQVAFVVLSVLSVLGIVLAATMLKPVRIKKALSPEVIS